MRNSSLVERSCAENNRASNVIPKLRISRKRSGRGAFCRGEAARGTDRGANRKANVGISNDNGTGNVPRRKTKGSLIYVHRIRVSRGLRISRKAMPMGSELIFLHLYKLRCRDGASEVPRTDGIVR